MIRTGLIALGFAVLATGCDPVGGQMTLEWDVTIDGQQVNTCAEVGATTVETLVTLEGTTEGTADLFDCDDFAGTTGYLDEGTYTVVVSLLDGNDQALDSSDAESGVPVTDGAETELGLYVFRFVSLWDPEGELDGQPIALSKLP